MEALDENPFARLPVPRPVDRYAYVTGHCRGKRVLDLGAYDETEVDREQHSSWRWLHAEIAAVAKEVLGVDASPKLKNLGSVETSVGTRIVYGQVEHLDEILADFQPDVIVAGELIEHTQDTLGWLSRVAELQPGTRIIATTPNTTSVVNVLLAPLRREVAHPDHIHVYSYRTLRTLAGRVPMGSMTVLPYYYNRHLFYSRVPHWASPIVTLADVLFMKPLQWLFPLLSTGLILDGVLGPAVTDATHHEVADQAAPVQRGSSEGLGGTAAMIESTLGL
jgi:Methyltransferase domain